MKRIMLVLAPIVPVVATACFGGGEESGPVVVSRPQVEATSGMDALIRGRLNYSPAGRCFTLEGEGGSRYPVVWPTGTTSADDSGAAVLLSNGKVVRQGDTVEGGGGFLQSDWIEAIDGAVPAVPAECESSTGEVAVFNHHAHIRVSPG